MLLSYENLTDNDLYTVCSARKCMLTTYLNTHLNILKDDER